MFHEGQQIGQYILIRKLGKGGFGEVWLAETDEDWFAIKLPHKDQVDWKAITQEIGLWTLCGKHPNVMPLIGARNFNGQIAIISEYAPDGSLEDLLRAKGKLLVEEAVEMTIGILKGLQHLHESGIIHRDLKPANILLDGKTPRLTDFGISRIISADSLSETISGTWAYMAPECFDGKRNVQTDIWSVGVIIYRMLTGNLPFPQKEQTALIGSIIMQEPELLADEISSIVKGLVSKTLSKNPSERLSLSSIRFDLENYIDDTKGFLNRLNQRKEILIARAKAERKCQIENINLTELIPYRKGDKWGFCDKEKNIVVLPKYDKVNTFSGGFAEIELQGKSGFVDGLGNEVVPLKYESVRPFVNGFAPAQLNGKWTIVNEDGSEIIHPIYDYVCDCVSEDLLGVGNFIQFVKPVIFTEWGFINSKGDEVIPLSYEGVEPFSEGIAWVRKSYNSWTCINKMGQELCPPNFRNRGQFSEGLSLVCVPKWGYINKQFQEVVPTKYDGGHRFSQGIACVHLQDKYGYVNKIGEEVIALKLDYAQTMAEDLALVRFNRECLFIDSGGDIKITLKYDNASSFSEGLASVKSNDCWGFIDKEGEEVIPLKYKVSGHFDGELFTSGTRFVNGIAEVGLNGKSFYIGQDGTEYFED